MNYADWRVQRLAELRTERRIPDGKDEDANKVGGLIDMIQATKPRSVIEIGSFRGISTEVFCLLCERVYSVDPNLDEKCWEELNLRCKAFPGCKIIRDWSPNALMKLPLVDMIYIDANHEFPNPQIDVSCALWRVNRPGWLAGHDYGEEYPAVMAAVKEVLHSETPRLFSDTSWCIRVM